MGEPLFVFESEPVFPDERAWFWKWIVLTVGSLLLILFAALVLMGQAGLLRVPRAWRQSPRKMYAQSYFS